MQMLMEKAMDQIKNEHLITFTKHLPICNPSLGPELFWHIQIHYDMNFELEMLIEKL